MLGDDAVEDIIVLAWQGLCSRHPEYFLHNIAPERW